MGDKGKNTGGMGTVAPNPYYTPEVAQRCMDEIFLPTIQANETGRPTIQRMLILWLDDYTKWSKSN